MTRRINARIDAALAAKLGELQQRTGKSTTEIVEAALEQYYDTVRGADVPGRLLEGFIGSADGPRDLSTNYNAELTRSLKRKRGAA